MTNTSNNNNRQAVVIIHGIGEQEPTQTLRGFADTIIPDIDDKDNAMGFKQKFYVKPDELSQLFDLRRITVPGGKDKPHPKTDFYEYYWAHQIRDTKLNDVLSWGKDLLMRWKYVPKRLKLIHSLLLLLIVLLPVATIVLLNYFPGIKDQWVALMAAGTGVFYVLVKSFGAFAKSISINFIGDAARYLTPKPNNIINRQNIRKEGLELLRKLHGEFTPGTKSKPYYDRIIIVAHSLGSVIAYDLLSSLWALYHDDFSMKSDEHQEKLRELQEKARELSEKTEKLSDDEMTAFQDLQSALRNVSAKAGNPWLVSDFITIGSPLSHAQLLLAKGREGLLQLQKERLFPTCPPTLEAQRTLSFDKTFHFEGDSRVEMKVPHHAALFALTNWTNIWFKNDYVGGPMSDCFGLGIRDIELESKTKSRMPFVSHTHYWDKNETESLEHIRDIIFPKKK